MRQPDTDTVFMIDGKADYIINKRTYNMDYFNTASSSSYSYSSSSNLDKPASHNLLTSRSSSAEPIHHNATMLTNTIDDILEDWPNRHSLAAPNAFDWESLSNRLDDSTFQPPPPHRRRVVFSERSSMQMYYPDPCYRRDKAYSKAEQQSFSSEALQDAIRIKTMVMRNKATSNARASFKHLIKNKCISLEEIIGIEHLVLGKSAFKLVEERQAHARAVLLEQHRMLRKKSILPLPAHNAMSSKIEKKLGEVSAERSRKSAKRARIRAAMAA